jgi:RNA polymerase subunit RPABC4/transcription elongation factor Spt4
LKAEDWAGLAVLIAVLGVFGLLLWIGKPKASSESSCPTCGSGKLVRVKAGRVLLRNKEVRKLIRDREGRLVCIEIHREIRGPGE